MNLPDDPCDRQAKALCLFIAHDASVLGQTMLESPRVQTNQTKTAHKEKFS